MLVLGITGNLGSGKTTVAGMFARLGAPVVDADNIVHKLLAPEGKCFAEVIRLFGEDILVGARLDRTKIAQLVFSDKRLLCALEKIIHPQVLEEISNELRVLGAKRQTDLVVLDIPLLFEAGMEGLLDIIVVVRANQQKQVKRSMKRLGITQRDSVSRIRSQMPLKEKILLADIVIDNRGSLNDTRKQVKKIWQDICPVQQKRE